MNIQDCLDKRLLQKTVPDPLTAEKSLQAARRKLSLASAELDNGLFDGCFVSAYAAMFHAARALLFKEGFKENSHYALYVFLAERFSGRLEERFITEFDHMRTERHNLMYGLDENEIEEDEAKATVGIVKEFIGAVGKLL